MDRFVHIALEEEGILGLPLFVSERLGKPCSTRGVRLGHLSLLVLLWCGLNLATVFRHILCSLSVLCQDT